MLSLQAKLPWTRFPYVLTELIFDDNAVMKIAVGWPKWTPGQMSQGMQGAPIWH